MTGVVGGTHSCKTQQVCSKVETQPPQVVTSSPSWILKSLSHSQYC